MEFRKSKLEEVDKIMKIIKEAQDSFKKNGVDQWQNGYPNEETIKEDIGNRESYVLLDGDNILGTTALSFKGESTYDTIYDGEWLTENNYAVIHRIAVDLDFKAQGLAGIILKEVEELCMNEDYFNIRVDTHRENIPMKKFLEKNGFKYCGLIYLKDGNERIAFEKILNKEKGLS